MNRETRGVGIPDDLDDADPSSTDLGPLGALPRLDVRQARFRERLTRLGAVSFRLPDEPGTAIEPVGPFEVLWRPSGLARPGFIAQLAWPELGTRIGLGLDTPVAHALVDRLLGFERLEAEGRLQLSPVEWGILTYLLARGLSQIDQVPGPFGSWDLTIDRAGPDPFDVTGLGQIITLRQTVRIGTVAGSARLWIPESVAMRWLSVEPPPLPVPLDLKAQPYADLTGVWRAKAGTIAMPRGLARLRTGNVLPLTGSSLLGTPQDPRGQVLLVLESGREGTFQIAAEPVKNTGGRRLTLTDVAQRIPTPREALAVNPPTDSATPPGSGAASPDVPVTLVVELGRLNLSLRRLADLKPGDVVELGRHSREPVELTSGGRLVARGELVQIDTELGVRVTNVFL